MKLQLVPIIICVACWNTYGSAQISLSDIMGAKLDILREILPKIFPPSSENPRNLRLAEKFRILQPRVSNDTPLPCQLNKARSKKRPRSVHVLRPGDIDVIGAIGDSLTSGNGLAATNILQVLFENRGLAPTIGGQGTWRQYLTLPNILKEFNPQLKGYSLRDSNVNHDSSQLNVAISGASSKHIIGMAKELIKRINKNSRINVKNDWKMINILIGGIDFCEMCKERDPEGIVEKHRKDLTTVLRLLRDNLPKTLVNVILFPRFTFLTDSTNENKPLICHFTQRLICPCYFDAQYQSQRDRFNNIISKWQHVEETVANDSEFDRDDFTVVTQPFAVNYSTKRTKEGLTDYSSLSQDCFHLSQKEAARGALSLWNNLLEPVGEKSRTPSELYNFKCPTSAHPFIFTRRNSVGKGR